MNLNNSLELLKGKAAIFAVLVTTVIIAVLYETIKRKTYGKRIEG